MKRQSPQKFNVPQGALPSALDGIGEGIEIIQHGVDLTRKHFGRAMVTLWTLKWVHTKSRMDAETRDFVAYCIINQVRANGEGCYKSLETMAGEMGCSPSKISRLKKKAIAVGTIKELPELTPLGGDYKYAPKTIYVIWRDELGGELNDLDAEFFFDGKVARVTLGDIKNTSPSLVKNDKRAPSLVKNDNKGIKANILLLNNNSNILAESSDDSAQKDAPQQGKLFDVPAPPPAPHTLAMNTPEEKLFFALINASRRANGLRNDVTRFKNPAQRDSFTRAKNLYGTRLKSILERIMAEGASDRDAMLTKLARYVEREGKANGHNTPQHPAPPPRKVATAEETERAIAASKSFNKSEEWKRLYAEMDANMRKGATG